MSWQDDPVAESMPWDKDPIVDAPKRNLKAENPAEYDPSSPEYQAKYGAASGGALENFAAAAGKFPSDLIAGAKQRFGMTGQDVAEQRRLDAPLMATKAGKAGYLAGGIATTIPALAVPGANTVAGAGALGAVTGALQPTTADESVLQNTVLGGAFGAGGQALAKGATNLITRKIGERTAAKAAEQAENVVRDTNLDDALKAGYVVPPSHANPTVTNRLVESISGKAQTQQSATVRNQKVTNRLIREDLGLAPTTPLNTKTLSNIRTLAGQAYRDIKEVGDFIDDSPIPKGMVRIYRGDSKTPIGMGKWYTTNRDAAIHYAEKHNGPLKYVDLTEPQLAKYKSAGPDTFFVEPSVAAKANTVTKSISTDNQYLDELSGLSESADEIAKDFPDLNIAGSREIQELQAGLLRDKFSTNSAIELMKKLRADANSNLAWNVTDPEKKALGLAQREAAGVVEDQVIRHLQSIGKGDLATKFDKARVTIAKAHSVQNALNEGTGNINAGKLATQLRKGKPLSGGIQKAAKFAAAFPKVAGEQLSSPGVSALDAVVATALGIGVHPAAAAIPLARVGTRGAILSRPLNRAMSMPNYIPRTAMLRGLGAGAPLAPAAGIVLPGYLQQQGSLQFPFGEEALNGPAY